MKVVDGLDYINCGDWVDNCTAVIEEFDGSLHLIRTTPEYELMTIFNTPTNGQLSLQKI